MGGFYGANMGFERRATDARPDGAGLAANRAARASSLRASAGQVLMMNAI